MRSLDAIVARLVSQNVFVQGGAGNNIFAGTDANIPTGAGPYGSVLETGGGPPIGAHNTKALRQPSFQITVRGNLWVPVSTKVDLAWVALGGENGLANILLGDIFFLFVRPAQEPFSLPNDAQGRIRLAFNIRTMRR